LLKEQKTIKRLKMENARLRGSCGSKEILASETSSVEQIPTQKLMFNVALPPSPSFEEEKNCLP